MKNGNVFQPDASQQRVIDAQEGYHLVLAPPGCGKTQILTERIRKAHSEGVAFEDMLCLTFTNRAARGMQERLKQTIDADDTAELYVGNIHRYCSKFLFDNNLIAAETGIIDDDDALSILANYRDEDERRVADTFALKKEYQTVIFFSHFMNQLRSRHARELRMHSEACTPDDVAALRKICEVQQLDFTSEMMFDVYEHPDTYRDIALSDGYDLGSQRIILILLKKMTQAMAYDRYKRENRLIDFEDLLIKTYDALKADTEGLYRRYRWIQIDEVQDLNPLQLSIVDLLTARDNFTVMYLGDEQQAIFSFMGAKMSTLDSLKQRCAGHIHRLDTNHRSPRYLLNVFNDYAEQQLKIDRRLLPTTSNNDEAAPDSLTLLPSQTIEAEYVEVAHHVARLFQQHPKETTAVVVSSNYDADCVSRELANILIPHFKVSGVDLFSTPAMKFLLAHFGVLNNEHNFIAWSRLLHGLGVCRTAATARQFMTELTQCAMLPTDFLSTPAQPTYVQRFADIYAAEDIVVFDTETTGLDPAEDDIVQIAAVKLRQGRVVEGSQLNLFIRTEREIPAMLGDIPNPILQEMAQHELLNPADALRQFMDYASGCPLMGHNAQFDYAILLNNLRRYLPERRLRGECPVCLDTLKLTRMLEPGLVEYKLKHLILVLSLEGSNSHLADEDVAATCSLIRHCYAKALQVLPRQQEFLAKANVKNRIVVLQSTYNPIYTHSLSRLDDVPAEGSEPALVEELKAVSDYFNRTVAMPEIEKLDYFYGYLRQEMLRGESSCTLRSQLAAHLVEISTLKEADLCSSGTLPDRVFVSTVHKAKGLEFDNVVVFDAVDSRYPMYHNRFDPQQVDEDARRFYVAMSRARRRLCIAYSLSRMGYDGTPRPKQLTPFINPILHYFNS